MVFSSFDLACSDSVPRVFFLLPPHQNTGTHFRHFHSRQPRELTHHVSLITFHLLPSHPLHLPHLYSWHPLRHPLFPLRLSRQIHPARPHRRSLHAANSSRRRRFQFVTGYSRLTSHSFLFPLSSLTTFYFPISWNPHSHTHSAYFLQHHHHHPHRRQRPLPPRPETGTISPRPRRGFVSSVAAHHFAFAPPGAVCRRPARLHV